MNKKTYDLAMLIAVSFIGIGTGMKFDLPVAMIVVGVLMIALTLVGVVLTKGRD